LKEQILSLIAENVHIPFEKNLAKCGMPSFQPPTIIYFEKFEGLTDVTHMENTSRETNIFCYFQFNFPGFYGAGEGEKCRFWPSTNPLKRRENFLRINMKPSEFIFRSQK